MISAAAFAGAAFKRTPLPNPDTMLTEEAYGRAGYAAIVSPLSASDPYTAGAPARVTIVVFKSRAPETEAVTLAPISPGVFEIGLLITQRIFHCQNGKQRFIIFVVPKGARPTD